MVANQENVFLMDQVTQNKTTGLIHRHGGLQNIPNSLEKCYIYPIKRISN